MRAQTLIGYMYTISTCTVWHAQTWTVAWFLRRRQ